MTVLFVDIETAPDKERLHLFDLPQAPETLPDVAELLVGAVAETEKFLGEYGPCLSADYLDLLVIAESQGKKRSGVFNAVDKAREAFARQQTELSVTPEYCRVVALGSALGLTEEPVAEVVGLPCSLEADGIVDERYILEEFWRLAEGRGTVLVGYNLLDFDLRVLLVRSALLGIEPTRVFDLKPWGKDCIDLMKARFPMGKAMKLKQLARLYGLPVPVEDVDGSMIAELIETNPAKVAQYVRSDIVVTRALYRFYGGYFFATVGGW
ncbi:MAG: hypothetical protein KJ077_08465 [Anaerolineae bacterium]|nr:hypothetical protein [Anaerolineae bacterium]